MNPPIKLITAKIPCKKKIILFSTIAGKHPINDIDTEDIIDMITALFLKYSLIFLLRKSLPNWMLNGIAVIPLIIKPRLKNIPSGPIPKSLTIFFVKLYPGNNKNDIIFPPIPMATEKSPKIPPGINLKNLPKLKPKCFMDLDFTNILKFSFNYFKVK
jgi:hypothetical protein